MWYFVYIYANVDNVVGISSLDIPTANYWLLNVLNGNMVQNEFLKMSYSKWSLKHYMIIYWNIKWSLPQT